MLACAMAGTGYRWLLILQHANIYCLHIPSTNFQSNHRVSTCIYLSPSLSARPVLVLTYSLLLPNPHRAVMFNTRDCTRCMDAPQPLVAHSTPPFSFTPIERYSKAQGQAIYLQLPNQSDLTESISPTHSIYRHLSTLLHHFDLSVARPFIPLSAFPFGFLRRSACRFLTPCPNTRSQIRALRPLNS